MFDNTLVPQWVLNEHPYDMQDHRYVLPKMLRRYLGDVSLGIEVGVAFGSMVVALLEEFPKLTMYAADPYIPYDATDGMSMDQGRMDDMYNFTNNRLQGDRVKFMRTTSAEAAKIVKDGSLDFAFIDARHQYDSVLEDNSLWYPKIRSGGILSGHDYCSYWPGVQKAVQERAAELNLELLVWGDVDEPPRRNTTIWAMQKP